MDLSRIFILPPADGPARLDFFPEHRAGFEIHDGGQGNEFGEKLDAYPVALRRGDYF
jgi:hypothetical protein